MKLRYEDAIKKPPYGKGMKIDETFEMSKKLFYIDLCVCVIATKVTFPFKIS